TPVASTSFTAVSYLRHLEESYGSRSSRRWSLQFWERVGSSTAWSGYGTLVSSPASAVDAATTFGLRLTLPPRAGRSSIPALLQPPIPNRPRPLLEERQPDLLVLVGAPERRLHQLRDDALQLRPVGRLQRPALRALLQPADQGGGFGEV